MTFLLDGTTINIQRSPITWSCGVFDEKKFKINKSKIRGEISFGMICAEDEVGLGDSHDGIMVLDENAEIGTKASAYFHLSCDYQLEIGFHRERIQNTSHNFCTEDTATSKHNAAQTNRRSGL